MVSQPAMVKCPFAPMAELSGSSSQSRADMTGDGIGRESGSRWIHRRAIGRTLSRVPRSAPERLSPCA